MTRATRADWLPLPLGEWQETFASLQLRTQLVGKTRLALAPMQNHWWQTALYVTPRGMGTSAMPYGGRSVEVELDLIDHVLVLRTSEGVVRSLPLRPQPIAEFFREYTGLLHDAGIEVHIWPVPVEVADPVPFLEDRGHAAYDDAAVERFHRVLLQVDRVLNRFRSEFLGKCSPSHFWWGSFDMACTRFSGRGAPPHPGGVPNLADHVAREAYSHECFSGGWWPGTPGGPIEEPAFYAYAYPEPPGSSDMPLAPASARYDTTLREWVLPQAAVLEAPDPDALVLEFLESTYGIAADLGRWSPDLVRPREP